MFCNRKKGSRCRVQGSGFRVQGSGFRVQGSGFRVAVAASPHFYEAMPESGIQVTSHSRLLIPSYQSQVTSHKSLATHPSFPMQRSAFLSEKQKRPYFLSEVGATCAVPPYIILNSSLTRTCAFPYSVRKRGSQGIIIHHDRYCFSPSSSSLGLPHDRSCPVLCLSCP